MKKIFILLFSFSAFAADSEVRISYQTSKSQNVNQLVFFVKPTEVKRWQNSNYFSGKEDVKLGQMKVTQSEKTKRAYERLKAILTHYEELNQKLKKVNKTWNDMVPTPGPHATVARVNNFLIPEDSTYNKEISELMESLISEKAELVDGVELVKANKQIQHVKNGKVTSTSEFLQPFYCERSNEKQQFCYVKNWGTLGISI